MLFKNRFLQNSEFISIHIGSTGILHFLSWIYSIRSQPASSLSIPLDIVKCFILKVTIRPICAQQGSLFFNGSGKTFRFGPLNLKCNNRIMVMFWAGKNTFELKTFCFVLQFSKMMDTANLERKPLFHTQVNWFGYYKFTFKTFCKTVIWILQFNFVFLIQFTDWYGSLVLFIFDLILES